MEIFYEERVLLRLHLPPTSYPLGLNAGFQSVALTSDDRLLSEMLSFR